MHKSGHISTRYQSHPIIIIFIAFVWKQSSQDSNSWLLYLFWNNRKCLSVAFLVVLLAFFNTANLSYPATQIWTTLSTLAQSCTQTVLAWDFFVQNRVSLSVCTASQVWQLHLCLVSQMAISTNSSSSLCMVWMWSGHYLLKLGMEGGIKFVHPNL